MSNEKITFNLAEAEYLYFEKKWSAQKIANLYGFKTYKSVLDKLKAAGHIVRSGQNQNTVSKTSKIDYIFQNIDSDIKGYTLGLFLGDSLIVDKGIKYICFDKEISGYISEIIGTNFSEFKTKDIIHLAIKPGMKENCYVSDINLNDIGYNNRFIPQYTFTNFNCNLNNSELIYLSCILRGIFDSSGTFGFPSNSDGSIFFMIRSKNLKYIEWCEWALSVLGMRNICRNINSLGEYELYSAQKYNIDILMNSIYQGNIGCKFKKERLLNVYNRYARRLV